MRQAVLDPSGDNNMNRVYIVGYLVVKNIFFKLRAPMISGPPVTMAWRISRLWMDEISSR
jgi:hypothetical protein